MQTVHAIGTYEEAEMRKVLFRFETGFLGASWEDEFEYEDDVSDSDINVDFDDWVQDKMSYMEYEWEEL